MFGDEHPSAVRRGMRQKAAVIGRVCRRGAATYCQVAPTSQGGFEFTFVLFAIMKLKTHGGTIYLTIASFRRQMNATNKCKITSTFFTPFQRASAGLHLQL